MLFSWIWYNLRLAIESNICLLDSLLCPILDDDGNPVESEDPLVRYDSYGQSLPEHFGWLTNMTEEIRKFPNIGVYFIERENQNCNISVTVGYQISFHQKAFDCKNPCCPFKTTESTLEWIDTITDSIMCMRDFTSTHVGADWYNPKTQAIEPWPYNIFMSYDNRTTVSPIRTDQHGISTFNIEFDYIVDAMYGAGYSTGDRDNCIPGCK